MRPPRRWGPASRRCAGRFVCLRRSFLTLVTLDPALGGDYLATWAANSVVVVTAGLSSAVRIHAVGEMIRVSGTRLVSVVLIGADKSDESLGLTPRPDEQAGIGVLGR